MDKERRVEAEAIFEAAIDLSAEQRELLLSRRCGDDPKLRAFVDRLLRDYDSGMSSFLQPPADGPRSETTPQDRAHESTFIGPYRILKTIGEGGMGTVYAAEQTAPVRRKVAIKVIKPGMDSKQAIARFEAERQALALMDHPNIARVLDAGETEQGRLYFVMDLVSGEPITDYCDRHMLSTRDRLDLFVPVCHAVQHAHQKGIIHRDLKPSNILVTLTDERPLPKVIDFGIAKATTALLTDKTLYTRQGQLIGTPAYMSPEQADIGHLDADTRSDIYSLGVILYELLTGALPFDPDTLRRAGLAEIQRFLREEEPPRPSTKVSTTGEDSTEAAKRRHTDPRTLARQLKGELDWIVLKAMEKDRDRRYETANSLAADIGRYLGDEAVLARSPSPTYRFRKFAKRHRVGILVAAAIAFGLVATGASLTWALIESNRQRAQTEAALEDAQEARHEAEEARDGSEAVTTFLSEMLASANPGDRGIDVTVQEMLGEASEMIGERFQERPLIDARLRNTIGATYHALGEYDVAARHLERAAETRRQVLGEDHPETLESLYHLAFAYGLSSRTDKAESLLRDVVEKQRRVLGETHDDTLASIQLLVLLYKDQRHYAEAESLASEVLGTLSNTLGEDDRHVHDFRYVLALVYERQNRFEEAGALIEGTLEAARRVLGDDHHLTLEYMVVLARQYSEMGRFEEAESLHLEALEGRRRVEGAESTWTLRSMIGLANLYAREGRYKEAERLYSDTIQLSRRTRGGENNRTVHAQERLARMWTAQGRYAEAESLLVMVVDVRRRIQGEERPATMQSLLHLATVYTKLERYDEAKRLGLEALELQRRVLGEEHQDLRSTFYNMACLDALRGDRKAALDWLRQAVEHGYSNVDWMLRDTDLESLHGDPEFEAILAEARRRAEEAPAAAKSP